MGDEKIKLLDVVALVRDRPEMALRRGSVGTVVEVFAPDEFEVEFVDTDGRTYGLHTLHRDNLMLLHYRSERVAG